MPATHTADKRPILEGWRKRPGSQSARWDYGWERLYEGKGAEGRQLPAYGWQRPGPSWQRGYGAGRPHYGWGRPGRWSERAEYYRDGPYAGRGPRTYRRPDHFIQEDVCEALLQHPDIDASDIEVSVHEGVVVLQGTVENRRTKYLAEDILLSTPGVKEVDNKLKVPPGRSRV